MEANLRKLGRMMCATQHNPQTGFRLTRPLGRAGPVALAFPPLWTAGGTLLLVTLLGLLLIGGGRGL